MARTALYRHFSSNGSLLYVGISLNPFYRLSQHKESEWFHDVTEVRIEWFDTKANACLAERRAIVLEAPIHNKTHNFKNVVAAIIEVLGSEAIEQKLGVSEFAVRAAKRNGIFPASWYLPISEMCSAVGHACPIDVFNWKSPDNAAPADKAG